MGYLWYLSDALRMPPQGLCSNFWIVPGMMLISLWIFFYLDFVEIVYLAMLLYLLLDENHFRRAALLTRSVL